MAKIQYMKKGGGLETRWDGEKKRQDTDIRAEKTLKQVGAYSTVDAAEITMYGPRWENHFTDTYVDSTGRWSATRRLSKTDAGKEHQPQVSEQGTLFSRAPGRIAVAFSAPSMRSTVPTLLGLAANEHVANWMDKDPRLPTHDSSLSLHSSQMVQRLQEKNVDIPVNKSNPTARKNNSYDWHDTMDMETALMATDSERTKQLSAATVKAGLDTTKAVLRGQQFQKGS